MRCFKEPFERLRCLPALGLCLVVLLFPLSGRGQAADEPEELGTVHVTAPRIRSALDDPTSTATVITADQFDSEFKTLPEVLSHTPGINIQQYGGLGQLSTVSIRGSSAEQVLVLLDGVPLNTCQGGGVDFSTIPLDEVERIEVVRGGGTAVYGPDAIGGVVNIITTRPEGGWRQSTSVTYGSFDTVKAYASAHGEAASTRFLLSATHFQSQGNFELHTSAVEMDGVVVQEPQSAERINNDFASENVLVKMDRSFGDRWSVLLADDFSFTERGQPGFAPPYHLPDARQKILRNTASLKVTSRDLPFSECVSTFRTFTLFNRSDYRNPTAIIGEEEIDSESRSVEFGADLSLDTAGEWGSFRHYLHAVAQVGHEWIRDEIRSGGSGHGEHKRLTGSLVVQDEWIFFDDRLSLIPVLRYLYTEGFGHRFSPKGGAILRLTDWLLLKGNVEFSYRPPTLSELYHLEQDHIGGNPDLEPEEAINSDVSVRVHFPRYSAEAVYFYRKVDESIFWLPTDAYKIRPVNTGPVNVNGAELIAEALPADWLRCSLNYTYLHTISRVTGSQLAGNPRHSLDGSASLIARYGEVTADVQFIDDIPLTPTGTVVVEWRVQADLSLTLDLREIIPWGPIRKLRRASASVQCKNVGDVHFSDARNFPLPGRSWFGTLTVDF